MLLYLSILWFCLNIVQVRCNCSGGVSNLRAEYTTTGTLTTENFRNAYPGDSDCYWLLEAAGPGDRVVIYMEEFLTEPYYDYLDIFDGNSADADRLWSDSGEHTGEWIVSTSRFVYLHFTSDYSVQYTGFNIRYISADSGVQANVCDQQPLTANSLPAQISSISVWDSCTYTITNSGGGLVRFSILVGSNDGLQVYDGTSSADNLIVEYISWFEDTNVYQSTGRDIYIVKPSGVQSVLYYEAVDASATVPTIAVTQPAVTEIYEYSCSGYRLTATTSYGHILSPEHPNNYPNNVDCDATITAQDPSSSIEFIILDMQVLYCCDFVEIFDGPDSTYNSWGSSWYIGDTRISTGSAIHIRFHSDSSGTLQGFQIDYREVPRVLPSCLPLYYDLYNATTTAQTITSPNYPYDYDNEMLVYWLITKPYETDNIVLNIRDMHMEHSLDCIFDKLTIYDGPCIDSPIIAILCGDERTVLQDSSGLYVLVEFSTDISVTNMGFEMQFYIGEHQEDSPTDKNLLYIIGIVVGGIVIVIIIICVCCLYHKWRKASYISPGNTSTAAPPGAKTKTMEPKRLTTHQLLMELQSRYGVQGLEKPPKPRRKMNKYETQPGPSGISTIGGNFSPHPPPQPQPPFVYPPPPYAGHTQDPAYPPNLFEEAARQAQGAPAPALVPASGLGQPAAPPISMFTQANSNIPGPSNYMTPADARKAGLYA